ncbi:MAG: SdrD B-like domain-containing protein [Thermoanaerobaculia bacterium]
MKGRFLVGLGLLLALSASVPASAQYVCFPSCIGNDAKHLALSGSQAQTFDSPTMNVLFGVPSTQPTFSFGIFDGDHGGLWDTAVDGFTLTFTLYGDPLGDGSTLNFLGQWTNADFVDNAWLDIPPIANGAAAQGPSGNYFYRLTIEGSDQGPSDVTVFKVRTADTNSLSLKPQAFNFIGALFSFDDLAIIYPNFPSLTPTTYDGMWTFYVRIPMSTNLVELWDGDLDHGNAICTTFDTDDPDTPGFPFLPPWAAGTSEFEGVANGEACESGTSTGAPPDDFGLDLFVRTPDVQYQVMDPLGNVYLNDNPSGNLEWERFSLSTNPLEPADYHVASLPAGIYTVTMTGMDLANFNSWFIPEVLGVCTDGTPECMPQPRPLALGDFVWRDNDHDGVQDGGEPGIDGVLMELRDANGGLISTTTTAGGGLYRFEVEPGTYTVHVAASNFNVGGALAGLTSSTGGESLTRTLTTDNDFTYDFGYYANVGSLGDRVWRDDNGNGAQESGEPGINGVTVRLHDSGGAVIATQTTAGDGNYSFTGLPAGSYSVEVVASTLPAGYVQTYDLDGTGTANTAAATLAAGQNRTDVDFGYRAQPTGGSLGDRLWLDADDDGVQDGGESGINGATVRLRNSSGTVMATQVTSGNGNYLFTGLAAGLYTVEVDATTLPAGVTPTYDLDGLATQNLAAAVLATGQTRLDVDFGYDSCKTCTGKVDRLTLTYLGPEQNVHVDVYVVRGTTTSLLTSTVVDPGQSFTLVGPPNPSPTYNNNLGDALDIVINGVKEPLLDTSCASAIGPGFAFGHFLVAAGTSTQGGALCPMNNDHQTCVDESPADPNYGTGGGHAFWLPGIDTDLVFTPDPGSFTVRTDGTASITGTAWSTAHPSRGFDVVVDLAGLTSIAPPGSPKKELAAGAYIENGGPIDPSTWFYYTSMTGSMFGVGDYAGAVIRLARTGPAFQVGVGANGKNLNLGGSAWFAWTVEHQPNVGTALPTTGQGDINVDLVDCKQKPVCDIKYKTPTYSSSSRTMSWNLTNDTGHSLEISYIYIWWPSEDGSLKKVKVNSTDIWSGTDYPNDAEITSFINGTSARTIGNGVSKNLKFQFSRAAYAWPDKYYMYVEFKDGCWVEWNKKK